jgi:manganese transport protein
VVLLSCVSKPVIQAELGRYTIATGITGLEALNQLPGPRVRNINWLVWAWAAMVTATLLQVGAMYGGVSQVMHLVMPAVPVRVWTLAFLALTLGLLLGGGYARVERIAMLKVALFTLLTVLAAMVLIRMPQFFSWAAVADGLRLQLPSAGLGMAVAVFGITGVGASELFMYPYWCIEKGYAQFTGSRDASGDWQRRARGWIRVMHVDIATSMIIYTAATVAFYLLGAGVLHGIGIVPAASQMIPALSNLLHSPICTRKRSAAGRCRSSTLARSPRCTAPRSPPPPRIRDCLPTCAGSEGCSSWATCSDASHSATGLSCCSPSCRWHCSGRSSRR